MSNEDQKTTLCISSVSLFVWQTHHVNMKLESKRKTLISSFRTLEKKKYGKMEKMIKIARI